MASNDLTLGIVGAALLGIAGCAFVLFKQVLQKRTLHFPNPPYETETIEDKIALQDVVGYFQTLHLTENVDFPFLLEISERTVFDVKVETKEGYRTILLGSFKGKDNKVENIKLIYSEGIDNELNEIIKKSKDGFVILK